MPLYFGVFVSLFAYLIGMELKKKFGWPVLNPLLVAIILVIAFLKATGITYTDYNEGASYISYFLTPATVCLALQAAGTVEEKLDGCCDGDHRGCHRKRCQRLCDVHDL